MVAHTYQEQLDRLNEQHRYEERKIAALQEIAFQMTQVASRLAEINPTLMALLRANDDHRQD
jgi:hypothetical protein